MKWLFVFLLAANAALFAWHQSRDLPSELAAPVPVPHVGKNLLLLSENTGSAAIIAPAPPASSEVPKPPLASRSQVAEAQKDLAVAPKIEEPVKAPTEKAQKEESKPKSIPPAAVTPHCFQVGELESEDARERFAAVVHKLGGQVTGRGTSRTEQSRFWVLLPPYPTAEAAAPALRRLKERGDSDYYFIRSGENRFAVSLGVFSTREIAERRLRQMRDAGLQPELRPVAFTPVRYRMDLMFRKDPGAGWPAQLPYGATIEPRACK